MFSLFTNEVSIGVAKTFYNFAKINFDVEDDFLSTTPIIINNELYGYAMRSRSNCNPIFISPGNYISFDNLDSVEPSYNLKITKKYKELGVDVFHIFENDNIDLWVSMIKNKLHKNIKIPARNCEIKQVRNKDLRDFLDSNHLQGYCGAIIAYGLYKNSELIACMTFSKPRFNKAYQYELIRFCVKQGVSIQGGASKLFKAFLRDYAPTSVISYANRRFSKGFIYKTLGFELISETYPNYYYVSGNNMYARQKFQKHKLKELFDKSIIKYYNENESESIIMSKNGFDKVYDAGNLTYGLRLDPPSFNIL